MHLGRTDTDTSALKERLELNSNSLHNLEDWIITQASITHTQRILDLGCGTGKLLKKISDVYSIDAVGLDASADGLDFGDYNLTTVCGNFDELPVRGFFDRILSTYAIYYAKDMMKTIKAYQAMLTNSGQMFLSGPAFGSNKEFYAVVYSVMDENSDIMWGDNTVDWLSKDQIEELGGVTARLENKIYLDSREKVMTWWRNHNSFCPELEQAVAERIPETGMELSKNVLGVRMSRRLWL